MVLAKDPFLELLRVFTLSQPSVHDQINLLVLLLPHSQSHCNSLIVYLHCFTNCILALFQVDEMFRDAPIKRGNFDYLEFTRILKYGKKENDE